MPFSVTVFEVISVEPAVFVRNVPGAKITRPAIRPLPPSAAPFVTITSPMPVPLPARFVTSNVPPSTSVPPSYVFPTPKITVPAVGVPTNWFATVVSIT